MIKEHKMLVPLLASGSEKARIKESKNQKKQLVKYEKQLQLLVKAGFRKSRAQTKAHKSTKAKMLINNN